MLQRAIASCCYHEQAVARLNWLEQEKANRLDDLSNTWHQIITLTPSKADAEAARKRYLAEMAAITREYDLCIGSQREAFEPR